ncbi:hypothetical protein L195_g049967, partial [Trifolium pratense]
MNKKKKHCSLSSNTVIIKSESSVTVFPLTQP